MDSEHLKVLFAVGSYTNGEPFFTGACGEGITLCSLDPVTGDVARKAVFTGITNPSYLCKGEGNLFYSVSECFTAHGSVWEFRLCENGIVPLWNTSSHGVAPCHVSCFPGGIAATNYVDGTLVLLSRQGCYQKQIRYLGSGCVESRQGASHPHQSVLSPGGQWILVPDLGADCLWTHCVDGEGVSNKPPGRIPLPPGTGPRHLVFHRESLHISVLGELSGALHTGRWLEATGEIEWLSRVDSLQGTAHASAIRQHPFHPIIYSADRLKDELIVYEITKEHTPRRIASFPAGGATPRDFDISPDGGWIVAACQNSSRIVVHKLANDTGLPVLSDPLVHEMPSPACILFL